MKRIATGGALPALIAVATAPAAWADVTPQEVWQDWLAYIESAGYVATYDTESAGDALTVRDLRLVMALPEDDEGNTGRVETTIDRIVFDDAGDGTVSITLSDEIPISITGEEDDEPFAIRLAARQPDLDILVSGDPGALVYDYSASRMALALEDVVRSGETLPAEEARGEMVLTDFSGRTSNLTGDLREIDQTAQAGSLSYTLDFRDPDSGDLVQMSGQADDLEIEAQTRLPLRMTADDMQSLLDEGFAAEAVFSYGAGRTSVDAQSEDGPFQLQSNSAGGRLGVAIDGARIGYDVSQSDVEVEVTSAQMPMPVTMTLDEIGFSLALPHSAGEEPEPFSLGLTLAGFTISDAIWNMIDPAGQLPRDPASIVLDLSGRARVLADLFDPEAMESDAPPVELSQLSLQEMLFSAAGARLTGQGQFEFEGAPSPAFGGLPQPEGTLNLTLSGGNALLDTLVQMGLVPEEDATGMRMMMALFTVPGDAPDTLTSTIEINESGQIFANGQRIQ